MCRSLSLPHLHISLALLVFHLLSPKLEPANLEHAATLNHRMSEPLTPKPKTNCRWDIVSLGEVMLRLDPGEERIATTRSFAFGKVVVSTTSRAV